MSIIADVAMPTSPAPAEAELYVERNQSKIYSFSKLLHIQKNLGDRWIGKITLPVLNLDQAAEWLGFFDALDGYVGKFRLPHPDFTEIRGHASNGQGRISGAGQLGTQINTSGWGSNMINLFRRGDIIEVDNRMKRITADASSDSGGSAILNIAPAFYTAPSNNASIRTVNAGGVFQLSEGFVAPTSDALRLHTISFAVEEALR